MYLGYRGNTPHPEIGLREVLQERETKTNVEEANIKPGATISRSCPCAGFE